MKEQGRSHSSTTFIHLLALIARGMPTLYANSGLFSAGYGWDVLWLRQQDSSAFLRCLICQCGSDLHLG